AIRDLVDRDHFAARPEGLVVQDRILRIGLAPIPGAMPREEGQRVDVAADENVEGGGGDSHPAHGQEGVRRAQVILRLHEGVLLSRRQRRRLAAKAAEVRGTPISLAGGERRRKAERNSAGGNSYGRSLLDDDCSRGYKGGEICADERRVREETHEPP